MSTTLTASYKELYDDAMTKLNRSILFKSRVHGEGHIERVINLGAFVAQGENLSEKETGMLLFCCSYHDIGRKSDWYCPKHGTRSAKMIESGILKESTAAFSADEIAIMEAAIASHSDKDKNMMKYAEFYHVADSDLFIKIASCLKDADNLDRVRLKDFNPKYLRHDSSRQLADYAQALFDSYKTKIS